MLLILCYRQSLPKHTAGIAVWSVCQSSEEPCKNESCELGCIKYSVCMHVLLSLFLAFEVGGGGGGEVCVCVCMYTREVFDLLTF